MKRVKGRLFGAGRVGKREWGIDERSLGRKGSRKTSCDRMVEAKGGGRLER